jgi:DNA-binding NarL/FixJ family response regulator
VEPGTGVLDTGRTKRYDRNVGGVLVGAQPPSRLPSVEIRKTQVHQHEVGLLLARERETVGSGRRRESAHSFGFEHVPDELCVPLVVVHDQHERSHCVIVWPVAIRVVLADDHYLVREGVRRLLETDPEIEVAAACCDLPSLLAAVEEERPDVVVTDIRMPPNGVDEGIQAAEHLRTTHPEIGVVVLSQYGEPGYAVALLEGGTAGRAYLLKERVDDLAQLVGAIRAVADGGSMIDPKVVEGLVAEKTRTEASPLSELTPREWDVLREMAEGRNNAAIAKSLVLTERSVEKVIHSIFQKLGLGWEPSINKRVKAVILFLSADS